MNFKRAVKIGLCLCASVCASTGEAVGSHAVVRLQRTLLRDSLHLTGVITENPTRTREITARVDGRVERLFSSYSERWIRKGETLLTLYSPDLASAQSDYLLLLGSAASPLRSARERLLAMGFREEGIRKLEAERKAIAVLPVISPVSGYALDLSPIASSTPAAASTGGMDMEGMTAEGKVPGGTSAAGSGVLRAGMHVARGQTLFRVNDLRKVWALLSVPDPEAARLLSGQRVRIRVHGAGEYSGRISIVDPYYPENSRSAQAKVVLDNPGGRMRLGALADAWVNPVPDSAWVLPRTAVVDLGERKIVWLRSSRDSARFQARSVVLGRALGEKVEVRDGLSPQDEVAENGSFLYDSENFLGAESVSSSAPAMAGHAGHTAPGGHAGHEGMAPELILTQEQEALAGIRTQKAMREKTARQIVLTAAVRRSEENRVLVVSHAPGRMLKVFAPVPGQTVRAGRPLYALYSEEMAAAAQEYRLAAGSREAMAAAERKLRLYGLTPGQIRELGRGMDTAFVLLAPRGGVIQSVLAREGRIVNAGDPLFEILDLDTVWLEAFVFPQDWPFLAQGKGVEIRFGAFPAEKIRGVLFHLPAGRPEGAAGKIHVRVGNTDSRYRPGMAAKVHVSLEEREALMVEKSALIRSRSDVLWVRTAPYAYSRRMVRLGSADEFSAEVLEGLMEGEEVVVSGAYLLQSEHTIRHGAGSMQGMKH